MQNDGKHASRYKGTFDGQGYTVSGLYFNDTDSTTGICVGLFGCIVDTGRISDVSVENFYFKAYDHAGGVCGANNGIEATIINCKSSGEISTTGYNSFVGGVCGNNDGGKTTEQFASGKVAYLLSKGCTVNSTPYDGSVWGQTLGESGDAYPVLGGKKVLTDINKSKYVNDIIIYGQNAVLDGTINFSIYVAADDNYEWSAKINGSEVTKPEKGADGLYAFTFRVAAKDMANEITFTLSNDDSVTTSVLKYLNALDTGESTKLAELVSAMKAYGNAANAFFGNGTVPEPSEDVTADDLSGYAFTKGTAPAGISYYGSSLILKSETTVRHYFQLADGQDITNFKFYVNGVEVTPVAKQDYYYIDIENISADKLGTAHTVKIGNTEVISGYSALSYAKTVLDKSADNNLQNIVKTLYLYNKKALAYNQTEGGN